MLLVRIDQLPDPVHEYYWWGNIKRQQKAYCETNAYAYYQYYYSTIDYTQVDFP